MLKKIAFILCFTLLFTITACGGEKVPTTETAQLESPAKGETIAVMNTDMGEIKMKFFPAEAPKAVENFISLAREGYYDGVIFHRVINDFMIQSGDPTGIGTGGESIWGKGFEDEFSEKLQNYRGALSMANSGADTNGSQFFIVQADSLADGLEEQMIQVGFDSKVIDNYKELGGAPWLDYGHTVFGQVFEGMDVVDKIAAVKVDSKNKPVEDVKIVSIEITTLDD